MGKDGQMDSAGTCYESLGDNDGVDVEDRKATIEGQLGSGSFVKGMFFAASVGCFGGSILVPMHYVDSDGQGVVFLPSFGIGVLVTSPVMTVLYFVATGQSL